MMKEMNNLTLEKTKSKYVRNNVIKGIVAVFIIILVSYIVYGDPKFGIIVVIIFPFVMIPIYIKNFKETFNRHVTKFVFYDEELVLYIKGQEIKTEWTEIESLSLEHVNEYQMKMKNGHIYYIGKVGIHVSREIVSEIENSISK